MTEASYMHEIIQGVPDKGTWHSIGPYPISLGMIIVKITHVCCLFHPSDLRHVLVNFHSRHSPTPMRETLGKRTTETAVRTILSYGNFSDQPV